MKYTFSETYKDSGDKFDPGGLVDLAYAELPELHKRPLALFRYRLTALIEEHTRIEIFAHDEDGKCVGGFIAGIEEDCHVGYCLVALLQYVDPEARNAGVYNTMFRMFKQAARDTGVDAYMYPHRVGPGKYLHTYRSL